MTTSKEQEAFGLVVERHKSSASENDIRNAFQRFKVDFSRRPLSANSEDAAQTLPLQPQVAQQRHDTEPEPLYGPFPAARQETLWTRQGPLHSHSVRIEGTHRRLPWF